MRIVSLVPSITDLLYAIDLNNQLVGITRYCIPPKSLQTQPIVVGGTKNIDVSIIQQLKPDLIIANKEENDKVQVQQLEKTCSVWITNISNVDEALEMILELGKRINQFSRAEEMVFQIKDSFKQISPINKNCLYLIWNHPIMVAGGDTFIHAMLVQAGFTNLASKMNRYPTLTESDLIQSNPDFLLLSSEPYAFRQHHVEYYKSILPNTNTILVDGQMFSWYGSKMMEFSTYINRLFLS